MLIDTALDLMNVDVGDLIIQFRLSRDSSKSVCGGCSIIQSSPTASTATASR